MLVRVNSRIVIDETTIGQIIEEVRQYFPFTLKEWWIEENRCISFKINYNGLDAKIKAVPCVKDGQLAFDVIRLEASKFPVNLSGFLGLLHKGIASFLKAYKNIDDAIGVNGSIVYLKHVKSNFAGISEKQVVINAIYELQR